MANRFEISTVFKAVDKMTAPITAMQSRLGAMTRSAQKGFRGVNAAVLGLGASISSQLGIASVLSVGALTASLTSATMAGVEFEQTMVNAAAKFGGGITRGSEQFKQLESAAMRAGSTTEFTATQAAQALNYLAMVGLDAQTSIAALPGLIDLATASQTDLGQATDIATDTMGAFNMQAKTAAEAAANLARVSDVMAKTANTSNTDMQMLFETLKKGGPVATLAGASFETVAAQAGIMANAGIKAEVAGTAIANAFLNLSNPTGAAAKVVQRLGLRLKQANGSLKDLPDLIDEVNAKTAKLTKTQRQAAIEALFGREGLAGNVAVLQAGGDALRKYRSDLENATGSTQKMAAIMRDTTRGSLNGLNSAIEGVSLKLFAMTGGHLKEAIDRTTEWVRANGDLIAQDIGGFLLGVADNFDQIVAGVKLLGGVMATLWAFNTALSVMSAIAAANPIVLLLAGLVAAATAVVLNWGKVQSFLLDSWAMIESSWDSLWTGVENVFSSIMDGIAAEWDGFINRWINRINSVSSMLGFGAVIEQRTAPTQRGGLNGLTNGDVPVFAPSLMVSPQQRTAAQLQESNTTTTNRTEVVIRDETTHSSVSTPGVSAPGLVLKRTGAF